MKRLFAALKYDIIFQYRHGFYHVYLIFTILYAVLLRLLPVDSRLSVATIIILSDPGILGYFVIGALVMLEKGQNLYSGLFTTPLKTTEYLTAKAISLSLISLTSSLIIAGAGLGRFFNPLLIIPGIFMTAVFFTLAGFVPAMQVRSLPVFLLLAPAYIISFYLPILPYLGLADWRMFYWLPTAGALFLIDGAFMGLTGGKILYSLAIVCLWIWIAWRLAQKVLNRHILKRGREGACAK